MKVALDATSAFQQGAGIGRYTLGLLKALATYDRDPRHRYILFVAGPIRQVPDWLRAARNFVLISVPIPPHYMAIIWQRLRLPLFLDLLVGGADIVHAPDFTLPPVLRARKILTIHDLTFMVVPQTFEPALQSYLARVVPRSITQAGLVLADSYHTRNDLLQYLHTPPSKIEILYPGIEASYRPVTDSGLLQRVKEKYHLPNVYVLSVGTVQPRKNFSLLVHVLHQLIQARPEIAGDLHLVIVGGRGWLEQELYRTIETLQMQRRVHILGYVAESDLPAIYSLARLFAFPSLYEGFGFPPLEAMACGTPVLCSDRSSLSEVVGEGGRLLPPVDRCAGHSIDLWAENILELLQSDSTRRTLIAAGFERVRHFTWDLTAHRLLDIYAKILS
ncbi:MAG: glycosyltransferase family 1 protein [Chloroflexi bacterium]|nr:glycosyltransferase family 1 protein [Chloroflexota bacterium]